MWATYLLLMAEEAFMMLSLKESKAKRLAQVIGNDTSRRILEYLAQKEGTETQISEDLKIPISTTHYSLKQLVDNNLVLAEEFHYSSKGREVVHYKLANKLIIIAPKEADRSSIMESLKTILPVGLLVLAGAWVTSLLTQSKSFAVQSVAAPRLMADAAGKAAAGAAQDAMVATAPAMVASSPTAANLTSQVAAPVMQVVAAGPSPWLIFLIGAVFALAATWLVLAIRGKHRD
jgi:DNA-binding transcriptional ArsR family regulator